MYIKALGHIHILSVTHLLASHFQTFNSLWAQSTPAASYRGRLCLKESTTRAVGTAKEGKTASGTSMTNIDYEKLDTDNYAVWSVEMKAFLIIKKLWSAVTGEGTLRPGSDEKALPQLALHVKDHHLPSLSKASTAAEAW